MILLDLKKSSTLLVLLMIGCVSSNWLYSALYVISYPIYPLIICLIILILFLEFIIVYYFGGRRKEYIFTFIILIMSFYLSYGIIRPLMHFDTPLNSSVKFFIAVGSVLMAAIATNNFSEIFIYKFKKAIAVGGVLYIISPLVYSYFNSNKLDFNVVNITHPTMIIVLDEFSDTASRDLVKAIKKTGLDVVDDSLFTDGKNTLDVIPRFFLNADFSDAQPCSSAAICSKENVLNFSKLNITGDVDFSIVGFHHPYCEINGLSYCYRATSPLFENALTGFGCYWSNRFGLSLSYCTEQIFAPKIVNKQRNELLNAVNNSTFWQNGGLFFVHMLLPHPPGISDNTTLDAAYGENIEHATTVVLEITKKLSSNFQNGFQLYVTSDHPLRPSVWCNVKFTGKCDVRQEFKSNKVPLISVSNVKANKCPILTNTQIFSCIRDDFREY